MYNIVRKAGSKSVIWNRSRSSSIPRRSTDRAWGMHSQGVRYMLHGQTGGQPGKKVLLIELALAF